MRLFMLGAGGHARSVADALPDGAIEAVVVPTVGDEDDSALAMSAISETELLAVGPNDIELVNGVGQVTANGVRQEVYRRMSQRGFRFRTIIHPTASVSRTASLGAGVQVLAAAVVGPGATIGDNTIVNTGAVVEHGCTLGACVHVAPGATVCGDVAIGDGSMIGAGATIVPGLALGAGAQVGAGAVVLRDVAAGDVVVGAPARPLT